MQNQIITYLLINETLFKLIFLNSFHFIFMNKYIIKRIYVFLGGLHLLGTPAINKQLNN